MFGEHDEYLGKMNLAFHRGLCVSGSAHVSNGGSGGMMSTLPCPRISEATFQGETLGGESSVTFVKR